MRHYIEADRPAPRTLGFAVEALERGGVIIYPTDTGYAFGCALSSVKGIAALRRLKGIHSKHEKPLTMLVQSLSELGRYGRLSDPGFRMVRRLLPGPYTMVVPARIDVPRAMKNRAREVGVRFPNHAACNKLVEMLGEPLLTGSVTPGETAPELEEVEILEARHRDEVSLVLDAGPLWPDPSTVLRITDDDIEVLREGQGPLP